MVYSYTPTYYTSLQDSITSLCKNILPFSLKKKRLPAAESKLAKLQSDNLKWQQDSFHKILNMMGLHKEGILSEHEVSSFRASLLETLIASPLEPEHPSILRDKLLFLQELLYAKCISQDEYHASKRPLLQRLAVQGAEIEVRDVIVGGSSLVKMNSEEEWSDIDLKDEQFANTKESSNSKKSKHNSALRQIKGAASALSSLSHFKHNKTKEEKSIFESASENPFWNSNLKEKEGDKGTILMPESIAAEPVKENGSTDKAKCRPFRTLFQKEQRDGCNGGNTAENNSSSEGKSTKRQWGFEGFKKWKKNDVKDENADFSVNERRDRDDYTVSSKLVLSPIGEGPDTKQIKKKLHSNGSSSDFFIDKVLGEKIKKELSRIQTELCTTNPNPNFSEEHIEAISTRLPVDKADLKKFFPKSWCDRYGDVVLDVVKKEFKDHVGDMEHLRNAARRKHGNSTGFTSFEDSENCHPNLFTQPR